MSPLEQRGSASPARLGPLSDQLGTNITRIVKRDATGGYFDEIYTGRLRETAIAVNTWVVRERAPLRIFSRTGHERNDIYTYEGVLLPLSQDGERVNMVLGCSSSWRTSVKTPMPREATVVSKLYYEFIIQEEMVAATGARRRAVR